MTDYSEMSDQEINMAIASMFFPNDIVIESKSRPPSACITGHPSKWVDYCNNEVDAWPIIAENRIGIIPAPENGWWKAAHRKVGSDSDPYHMNKDSNPLRAAMIVFLMMQEPQNAKIPTERDS